MTIKTSIALAALSSLTLLTALTVESSARGHRMQHFDAKTGEETFNDNKMDGKACVIGQEVEFNPETGKFTKQQVRKCNF